MHKSLPSTMTHSFSQAPQADIPRSSFDRSHGVKTTFDAGYLVPIFLDEALPGDTFNLKMTAFSRLATPIHPVMDNMYMDSFFFAVPMRLVWDNWERFNGAQDNPDDSTDYLIPTMTSTAGTGYLNSSIHDYMGIPTEVPGLVHSSLWHRAYNLIWNEWFRDQNLQDSVVVDKDDGPDSPTDYVLLRRGKRYDYFTSCLPFPQKGVSVPLPLSGNAPLIGFGSINNTLGSAQATSFEPFQTSSISYPVGRQDPTIVWKQDPSTGALQAAADLSAVNATTINALREAFQIQRLLERDARGGTRYVEILKSHFNVISPDFRLQRPEYLGGGSSPVIVTPIAQTSSTDATTPQGNLAAYGVCSVSGHGFTKSFTEHCLILGMVAVRADLNYQQGLNRMFSRQTRFDFYWPALSHLGEQAVLNKEIYAQGSVAPTIDSSVFGYQERWAEYRYKPPLITGQFRSNFATSLDTWHLAQDFSALPVLNDAFIQENPPMDRIKALDSAYPDFIFDSHIQYKCARPMPLFSVPGLVDHF